MVADSQGAGAHARIRALHQQVSRETTEPPEAAGPGGERTAMTEIDVGAPSFPAGGLDALPPPAMARKAEDVGVAKAALAAPKVFALAVTAGAFIALGALFATTVTAGTSDLAWRRGSWPG